jgi:hypothetical protein
MYGLISNCLDDFLFSNPADSQILELILCRQMPFPFGGKTGILLYGTWGTGKTNLAELLPELLETAYDETWDKTLGVGQMPAPEPSHTQTEVFRWAEVLAPQRSFKQSTTLIIVCQCDTFRSMIISCWMKLNV